MNLEKMWFSWNEHRERKGQEMMHRDISREFEKLQSSTSRPKWDPLYRYFLGSGFKVSSLEKPLFHTVGPKSQ
jgi:hypothetical protein